MKRGLGLLSMVVKENGVPGGFARRPEPSSAMDTPDQVSAFDSQAAHDGPMAAVYYLTALACSRLTPRGGLLVDLGCGPGRFAAFLAGLRRDIRIVGYDLSPLMVETGNASLRAAGLADRVQLRQGDMTSFAAQMPGDADLINCLFAMHHLPSIDEVKQCIEQMRRAEELSGAGFLILDLVRPRHLSTAESYPKVFMPDAPSVFQVDTTNSLIAAYGHAEIKAAVDAEFRPGAVRSVRSRVLPLYQAFWRGKANTDEDIRQTVDTVRTEPLSRTARLQLRALRWILPGFPG